MVLVLRCTFVPFGFRWILRAVITPSRLYSEVTLHMASRITRTWSSFQHEPSFHLPLGASQGRLASLLSFIIKFRFIGPVGSTWTDAFPTAASFTRGHSGGFVQHPSLFLLRCASSPRPYSPGATSGWSIRLVSSLWLVSSFCWCLCWLVYCFGWSHVSSLESVALVCLIRLGMRLVCLVGLVCLLLCL